VPPVFPWLKRLGNVADDEMFRVFNMGIGMVLIVAEYYADSIVRTLSKDANTPAWVIGRVVEGAGDVTIA
jgi:phosphoribosylformylglycinamidine cyclo-ligase